ncbi:MAG TPA: type IV pilus biogenesis/stability protein PilW [Gammaproteobacteria bacterium]|jgi:type IV pilus assembly protein PilF|nr:type IV pilus biogenesis/stability protein PilW [Gammaproteobacteria bacterium]HRP86672.1 type IV pilus biogenesis/stability protein PilW [Gammaproteobacteria bacterium]
MTYRTLILLILAGLATGCASTAPTGDRVSDQDAARYNVQLGMNYLQRGDLEAAREKLERAVQQDPSLPAAHAALGILYERAGDMRRAGDHLRRATRLAPDDPNMVNNYGGFLCRQGERREGIRHFDLAAANPFYRTPEAALTNAGVCARGIPDPEAAENYFRRALDANRNYADALLQLADLSLETQRPLQARAFLQRYEAVSSASSYSLALGHRIETAAGDRQAASEYASRLRREFPDSREARGLNRD